MQIFQSIGAIASRAHGFDASLERGWRLRVRVMSNELLRIVVEPDKGLPLDRTWMIAPEGDTPWEGRNRDDAAGFSPPHAALEKSGEAHILTAGQFRLTLMGAPLRIAIEQRVGDEWRPWISDRDTGGFALTDRGERIRHFQKRPFEDRHFGLGDKTGPMDRTGRRFRMLQLDALGYDAAIGDPLYKHTPYMAVQSGGVVGGLFYDSLAPMTFDLGCERSNYHGIYRYVEIEEKGLDLWLIAGPDLASVTRRFAMLTGRQALLPRWSFGFAFTTMHHADDVNGQEVIKAFAERCRTEEIAISAIHFGSGYSSRGKRRYVFTWNKSKFPDAKALFARLTELGFPTVANLKPVLIDDHPDYTSIKTAGGFVKDEAGEPVLEQFWDGMGSYLDFTNPETGRWWQSRLTSQVLDVGFTAGWNDNNEYEIGRDGALATGFGTPVTATATRPLHALLMTRATYEATQARDANVRPFTVTRAGPVGLQRYCETWSGDNETSWHTLKWNLRNGLSMALSGQSKVGHDVGGFTGPRPRPELLCRWVEMMALHPRAIMNSWKPDVAPDWSAATVPWLYPDVLPQIREALNLRTTFLPLMYSLAYQAHQDGSPIIRPLFYEFPDDPRAYEEHDSMMLGPDVLFSPVVEEGARTKTTYLPKGPAGWIEFHTGVLHPAGSEVSVGAELGKPPIFIRVGAALALASATPFVKPHDAPARLLYLATAGESGTGEGRHFEDDGLSWGLRNGQFLDLRVALSWTGRIVSARLSRAGGQWPIPTAGDWRVVTPGNSGGVDLKIDG
ncbi:TIM-barrel domain-containing protein [Terrarubrum flagellatum]|uniref:TIM-barrel domain-containing protein n=1 Tax=Terrirubrum flagellatum TaxID=2895980 RepID=UPI0031452968